MSKNKKQSNPHAKFSKYILEQKHISKSFKGFTGFNFVYSMGTYSVEFIILLDTRWLRLTYYLKENEVVILGLARDYTMNQLVNQLHWTPPTLLALKILKKIINMVINNKTTGVYIVQKK